MTSLSSCTGRIWSRREEGKLGGGPGGPGTPPSFPAAPRGWRSGLTDPSSSSLQGSAGLAGKNGTDGQKVEDPLGCIPGWAGGQACGSTGPMGMSRTPRLSGPSLGPGLRAHRPLPTLVAWAAPVCTCPGDAGQTRTLQGQEWTLASESQGPALQEPLSLSGRSADPADWQFTDTYTHTHNTHTCTRITCPHITVLAASPR